MERGLNEWVIAREEMQEVLSVAVEDGCEMSCRHNPLAAGRTLSFDQDDDDVDVKFAVGSDPRDKETDEDNDEMMAGVILIDGEETKDANVARTRTANAGGHLGGVLNDGTILKIAREWPWPFEPVEESGNSLSSALPTPSYLPSSRDLHSPFMTEYGSVSASSSATVDGTSSCAILVQPEIPNGGKKLGDRRTVYPVSVPSYHGGKHSQSSILVHLGVKPKPGRHDRQECLRISASVLSTAVLNMLRSHSLIISLCRWRNRHEDNSRSSGNKSRVLELHFDHVLPTSLDSVPSSERLHFDSNSSPTPQALERSETIHLCLIFPADPDKYCTIEEISLQIWNEEILKEAVELGCTPPVSLHHLDPDQQLLNEPLCIREVTDEDRIESDERTDYRSVDTGLPEFRGQRRREKKSQIQEESGLYQLLHRVLRSFYLHFSIPPRAGPPLPSEIIRKITDELFDPFRSLKTASGVYKSSIRSMVMNYGLVNKS